jgi:hypothetical protein
MRLSQISKPYIFYIVFVFGVLVILYIAQDLLPFLFLKGNEMP